MIISGFPGFDRTSQAAADLRAKLAEATFQAAGGKRSDTYTGLGVDARRAVDLRAEIGRRDNMARLIGRGEARAENTQALLERVMKISQDMLGKANGLLGAFTDATPQIAHSARAALKEVIGILGEQFEGKSVFGGEDLTRPPVCTPDQVLSTDMFLQVQAAVQGLPNPATPAAGLAAAATVKGLVQADAGTPRVFSTHVTAVKGGLRTDSRQSVPIEEGVAVEVGLYAYRNSTTPTSTTAWPDTTGSWQGDVLRGLMVLGSFRADEASKGEGFTEMVKTVISSLRSGLSAVTEEAGALGASQQRLEAARKRHLDIGGQIEIQLGKVEHVELGEAITRATSTKSQLEASYRSMSMLSGLSLANFLR